MSTYVYVCIRTYVSDDPQELVRAVQDAAGLGDGVLGPDGSLRSEVVDARLTQNQLPLPSFPLHLAILNQADDAVCLTVCGGEDPRRVALVQPSFVWSHFLDQAFHAHTSRRPAHLLPTSRSP